MDTQSITITGSSTEQLLNTLTNIKINDNHIIKIFLDNTNYIFDTIDNVHNAINSNLYNYIHNNFKSILTKNKQIIKSGGNNDLYVVDDPDKINIKYNKKIRNKMIHLIPKKKKRK